MERVLFGQRTLLFVPLLVIFLGGLFYFRFQIQRRVEMRVLGLSTSAPDTRQPVEVNLDGRLKVKYPQDYTIVLLGDSMTEKLGNFDELRAYLKKYFPGKTFALLNYGFGSTNILSAPERLEKETYHGRVFRPILGIAFDIILIESFGHNPLSELPLEEGLQKQTETLNQMVQEVKKVNPKAKIVFVATIAPNSKRYAEGIVTLLPEKRTEWARERVAYIQNHISYAHTHHIPLIDIYSKSLSSGGDGNLDYINTADFIHPSASGIYLISEEIARSLSDQGIIRP